MYRCPFTTGVTFFHMKQDGRVPFGIFSLLLGNLGHSDSLFQTLTRVDRYERHMYNLQNFATETSLS